jgi:hypothetical protein
MLLPSHTQLQSAAGAQEPLPPYEAFKGEVLLYLTQLLPQVAAVAAAEMALKAQADRAGRAAAAAVLTPRNLAAPVTLLLQFRLKAIMAEIILVQQAIK